MRQPANPFGALVSAGWMWMGRCVSPSAHMLVVNHGTFEFFYR